MPANIFWLILPLDNRAAVFRIAGDDMMTFSAQSEENITLAQAVSKVFQEQEYDAQPVLLALRSCDVLSVSLPADSAANRQAMLYELEEYVPLPAEQFTADFLQHTAGCFAGVLAHQRILPLLDELATERIFVQAIVPLAVLAAQYLSGTAENTNGIRRGIIWTFDTEWAENRVELFFLTPDGQPLSWQLLDTTPESLKRTLEAELLNRDGDREVMIPHLPDELRAVLNGFPQLKPFTNEPYEDGHNILLTAIARQSGLILSRKQTPWWDFCRGQLAMRGTDKILGQSLRTLLWGSVAFLTALALVFFIRGFQYRSIESRFRQEQESVFREALPEQKLQTGFRNRLESEYKKMSAQRENTGDLPQRESVLIPLLGVLKSLPPKVRYRFPEIRIEADSIRLDGQLQVHGDAEVIATALENGGFAVETPSTQQTGTSGVSVRLTFMRKGG